MPGKTSDGYTPFVPRTRQVHVASRNSARILITRRILPEARFLLEGEGFRVEEGGRVPMPREVLIRRASRCEGLLSMLSDRVDAAFLDACPRLRAVANYAVGFDNIDLRAARARGVQVTNTPGVLTRATAELAWTLILACARRVLQGDRMLRSGRFRGWDPLLLLGSELGGKTLLVVGPGRIGKAVGRIGLGFGMRVLYAGRGELEALLPRADVLSLHVPLTPATRHLIGRAALSAMKAGAILVNTARGPVVDEGAMVEALREGRLAAAGLDVYEREPRLASGLARLPNVVLLPHLGSATREARAAMARRAALNLSAALSVRRPPDLLTA